MIWHAGNTTDVFISTPNVHSYSTFSLWRTTCHFNLLASHLHFQIANNWRSNVPRKWGNLPLQEVKQAHKTQQKGIRAKAGWSHSNFQRKHSEKAGSGNNRQQNPSDHHQACGLGTGEGERSPTGTCQHSLFFVSLGSPIQEGTGAREQSRMEKWRAEGSG